MTFIGKFQSANMALGGGAKTFWRFGASSPSILRPCVVIVADIVGHAEIVIVTAIVVTM